MSTPKMSTPKFEIKDKEVFRDGEKIGFFNDPDNHFQATRGNAQHREEFLAWQEKRGGIEISPPQPETVENAVKTGGPEPVIPTAEPVIAAQVGDDYKPPVTAPAVIPEDRLPVPAREPQIRPGIGVYEPSYFWWAWNQDDATFKHIYSKDKATFKKDHGGYIDKAVAHLGKGATL